MEKLRVLYEVRTESVYVGVTDSVFLNLVLLVTMLIVPIETCGPVIICKNLMLIHRLK
jgi:hypothetical protein